MTLPAAAPSVDPLLAQPLYGASFIQAFRRFWAKYATFSGRASRSEFWWWYLANVLVTLALFALTAVLGIAGAGDDAMGRSQPGPLIGLGALLIVVWSLATILPTLALSWRRLHDTGRSGGFWFVGLIPGVGGIILLVLLALDSDRSGARYDA